VSEITFGAKAIAYTLQRADRRTLSITVNPDLSVLVRAPPDAAHEAIEQVVKRRARWILRQQRFFSQFIPRTPEREYVGGETHLYLGRQYRLRVQQSDREGVRRDAGYIYVSLPHPDDRGHVKLLLDRWYARNARRQFRERLTGCIQALGWDMPKPSLQVRFMTQRWGSCSPSGRLTLNVDLIRAPRSCIDYVITHEVCHLKHPHHSTEFYRLLSGVMPDWEERKLRLERLLS
jgi:predicted metal-dependent hydrolase